MHGEHDQQLLKPSGRAYACETLHMHDDLPTSTSVNEREDGSGPVCGSDVCMCGEL